MYKKIYFLDVCFSSKFANCKCIHGTKSAKLNALEKFVWFVLRYFIYQALKKFAIFFSKIFKDLCTENRAKLPWKIQRQHKNRNFSILNSSTPSQNIKTRTSCRRPFENVSPSTPTEITFEISFNLVRS